MQIQLTLKDYLQAFRAHMGRGYYFLPTLGVVMALVGLFHPWIKMPRSIAIGLIAAGAYFPFIFPIILRRQFKSNEKLSRPRTVTVSGEGIESISEYGDSRTKWSAFVHFAETKTMLLLYPQPHLFLVFPKRFFSPEQLNEFGQLVRANVAPRKKTRKVVRTILVWIIIVIAICVLYRVIFAPER